MKSLRKFIQMITGISAVKLQAIPNYLMTCFMSSFYFFTITEGPGLKKSTNRDISGSFQSDTLQGLTTPNIQSLIKSTGGRVSISNYQHTPTIQHLTNLSTTLNPSLIGLNGTSLKFLNNILTLDHCGNYQRQPGSRSVQ